LGVFVVGFSLGESEEAYKKRDIIPEEKVKITTKASQLEEVALNIVKENKIEMNKILKAMFNGLAILESMKTRRIETLVRFHMSF
jgi:hypothetical protein